MTCNDDWWVILNKVELLLSKLRQNLDNCWENWDNKVGLLLKKAELDWIEEAENWIYWSWENWAWIYEKLRKLRIESIGAEKNELESAESWENWEWNLLQLSKLSFEFIKSWNWNYQNLRKLSLRKLRNLKKRQKFNNFTEKCESCCK